MTRPLTEHRFPRAPSRAAERIRRQAVRERADHAVNLLTAGLAGLDREFVFEVLRAIIRSLAARMAFTATAARSVGVLCGALADVAPGKIDRPVNAEVEAVFGKDRVA